MSTMDASLGRIARLRSLMDERGYDAVIVRGNANLRWLTGAERTFDFESAHTAFITANDLWFHTDSRYFNTFMERLGKDSPWLFDERPEGHPEWAAELVKGTGAKRVAIEDSVTVSFLDGLEIACANGGATVELPRMHGDIEALRMVKDAEEIALLERAQQITDAAFEHICGFIRVGQSEKELRLELERFMLDNGADGLSFDTIMATGANGANPHAQPGETRVVEGDMIVIDYGALYHEYHADMTRTVCVGEPGEEQRRVYDIVKLAHETCAAAIKPGVIGKDIHQMAVDIITQEGYGDYFGHGLGHGVGLEIHEKPCLNRLYDQPLPQGSVVTDEPGIYLPGRFGVRLEDTGVVEAGGFRPFARSPHELQIVGG